MYQMICFYATPFGNNTLFWIALSWSQFYEEIASAFALCTNELVKLTSALPFLVVLVVYNEL